MEKRDILEILDLIIESLRENPNQFNFKEVNVTGLHSVARGEGIGTQVISGAPGSTGMKITVSTGNIDARDIQDTNNQVMINKMVSILEEFKTEANKKILVPVISAILTKMLFYLMENIA